MIERHRQRFSLFGCQASDQVVIGNQPGEDGGHDHIKHCADNQRRNDADGQISGGILGFLRNCRYGVKTDISEEDDRGSGQCAAPPVWLKWMPVGRHLRWRYEIQRDDDEEE